MILSFTIAPTGDPFNYDLSLGRQGVYKIDETTLQIVTPSASTPSLSLRLVDNGHLSDDSASVDVLTEQSPSANTAGFRATYANEGDKKVDLAAETIRITIRGGNAGVYQLTVHLTPAVIGEPDPRPQLEQVISLLKGETVAKERPWASTPDIMVRRR